MISVVNKWIILNDISKSEIYYSIENMGYKSNQFEDRVLELEIRIDTSDYIFSDKLKQQKNIKM